jgi:hypothetical protein
MIQCGYKKSVQGMVRNQSSAWICHMEFNGTIEIPLQICMQGVCGRLFDKKKKD